MGERDRRIDVWMEKVAFWTAELEALRALLLETDLDETFKWRQPAYMFRGENVLMLNHRRDNVGLGFFRGSLMSDPEGVLTAPGENSQASRELRFASVEDIHEKSGLIRAYIGEAIEIHRAGRKVDFKARNELVYPDELVEALAGDEALSEAFAALTPGRQRSWVMHFEAAKKPETRLARIERGRAKIMDGKGQSEY